MTQHFPLLLLKGFEFFFNFNISLYRWFAPGVRKITRNSRFGLQCNFKVKLPPTMTGKITTQWWCILGVETAWCTIKCCYTFVLYCKTGSGSVGIISAIRFWCKFMFRVQSLNNYLVNNFCTQKIKGRSEITLLLINYCLVFLCAFVMSCVCPSDNCTMKLNLQFCFVALNTLRTSVNVDRDVT